MAFVTIITYVDRPWLCYFINGRRVADDGCRNVDSLINNMGPQKLTLCGLHMSCRMINICDHWLGVKAPSIDAEWRICVSKLCHRWFGWWLVAWSAIDFLSMRRLLTNFNEIWMKIEQFLSKKINLNMSSANGSHLINLGLSGDSPKRNLMKLE